MEKQLNHDVPKEILEQLRKWRVNWFFANFSHYIVGIVGILCSTIAATSFDPFPFFTNIAGVVSAVCFGILGFAKPKENYNKFVRAWRKLDAAKLKYKYGEINITELLDTVDSCHSLMNEIEASSENPFLRENFSNGPKKSPI